MIIFWTLAGGLAVLALAFVLVPLLRRDPASPDLDSTALNLAVFRQQLAELDADLELGKLDQAQYDAARHDLERELVHDTDPNGAVRPIATGGGRWLAPILALAIPAAAVGLYLHIGGSGIIPKLEAAGSAAAVQPPPGHSGTRPDGSPMPSLEVLAQQLAQRMEKDPNNAAGWVMLSRTWLTLNQSDKAAAAVERAYKLAPRDPAVLLAYVEALVEAHGRQLAGRPVELLDTLLEVEPGNANGLWLRGMAAFQAGDYAGAVARWEPLQGMVEPGGGDAAEVSKALDEARSRAGLTPVAAGLAGSGPGATPAAPHPALAAQTDAGTPASGTAKTEAPPGQAGPAAARITVNVALDPALAAQAPRDATVFIYAKAVAGPPMPLAAQRVKVADLPVTVTLDDAMAMMPQMRLSTFPQVTVGARISRSGQAMPQSGDLEGEVSPVASTRAEPVAVTISKVRP